MRIEADMNVMRKWLLALALAALMLTLPRMARADTYSGACGTSATYTVDTETGVLEISGTGAMAYYGSYSAVPWNAQRSYVQTVRVAEGITSLSGYSCAYMNRLQRVELPSTLTRIGAYCFWQISSELTVQLPSGVTFIGLKAFGTGDNIRGVGRVGSIDYAITGTTLRLSGKGALPGYAVNTAQNAPWKNCSSTLKLVEIGEGITAVGDRCFESLPASAEVRLPSTLEKIGAKSFSSALAEIVIPGGVTSIASDAFGTGTLVRGTTGDLTWTIQNSTLTFSGNGEMGDYDTAKYCYAPWHDMLAAGTLTGGVVFDGKITSIGDGAFRDAAQAVSIPETVTRIGDYAFYGCTKQGSVSFSGSLKRIGDHAFEGSLLTGASFASGLEEIGDYAFGGTLLPSVRLPGTLRSLGDSAFRADTRCACYLESVSVPASVTHWGSHVFADQDKLTYVTLAKGLAEIGEYAFAECTALTNITLPDSVKDIGAYAFYKVNQLNYNLPAQLETIGDYAFYLSPVGNDMDSVTLPSTVRRTGCNSFQETNRQGEPFIIYSSTNTVDGVTWKIADGVLTVTGTGGETVANGPWSCMTSQFSSLVIGEGIAAVDSHAFAEMGLKSVTLSGSLRTIGDHAFYKNSLVEPVIPEGVTRIEAYALAENPMTGVSLPGTLVYIGKNAFDSTASLSLHVPSSVTEIDSPIVDYKCLAEVSGLWNRGTTGGLAWRMVGNTLRLSGEGEMPAYTRKSGRDYDYTDAPWWLFRHLIHEAEIGEGITSVSNVAFYSCGNLTAATLPSTLTEIRQWAFMRSGLTSISLPDGLKSVGDSAFYGTPLSAISLPDGLQTIGDNAFADTKLTSIELPANLKSIGRSVFSGTKIASIELPANLNTLNLGMFSSTGVTDVTIPDSVETLLGYDYGTYAIERITFVGTPPTTIAGNAFKKITATVIYTPHPSWEGRLLNYGGTITWVKVNGSCGENAFWRLENETTLILSGTGTLSNAAWGDYAANVDTVVIEDGLSAIESGVLVRISNLRRVFFRGALPELSAGALSGVQYVHYPHGCPAWTPEAVSSLGVGITALQYCGNQQELTDAVPEAIVMPEAAPDCLNGGHAAYTACSLCGALFTDETMTQTTTLEAVTLPALGHSYEVSEFAWAEDAGACEVVLVCQRQDDQRREAAAVTSERTLEPTCTALGQTTYTASFRLGETLHTDTKVLDDIPAKGHTEVTVPGIEATCLESGMTDSVFCEVCGEELQPAHEIPALGHTEFVAKESQAPTCTEAGSTEEIRCKVCGEVLKVSETIPATGHVPETLAAVEPTCVRTGLTEGSRCSVCGEILAAQETLPVVRIHHLEEGACRACGLTFSLDGLKRLTLPAFMKVIGEEAFANTSVQAVILPAGCRRIERRAFADCEQLRYVFLPEGIEFIAEDAFEHSDVILVYQ